MTEVNVLFIHGAGPNKLLGGSLEHLRNKIIAEFGRRIYAPPAVDYTEVGLIARYLDKWKDAQILVGLSCGCSTINAIAASRPSEKVPFAMYCSPSILCGLGYVPPNVARATQATSNGWDPFNLGARRIVQRRPGTTGQAIDEIATGYAHVASPSHPQVFARLKAEIARAIA